MNLRSLSRGDAAVAVGALLLLISSFLPLYSATAKAECDHDCSFSTWHSGFLVTLASVVLTGLAAAALILLARFQGEAAKSRHIAGLKLGQWGIALAVFSAWSGLWALFTNGGGYFASLPSSTSTDFSDLVGHSFGAYLAFVAVLVIAGAAIATPVVPALQARLLPDKPPAPAPQAYPAGGYPGGYPGGPQPGGYGYPGGPQPGAPQQQWGAAPQPGPAQPQDASFGGSPAEAPAPAPAPAPATPAPDFAPFWFAVPAPRSLAPEDNPGGPSVGELLPGTWYLAVEQRGTALVAQLQDGRRGLLNDTSGIQRG